MSTPHGIIDGYDGICLGMQREYPDSAAFAVAVQERVSAVDGIYLIEDIYPSERILACWLAYRVGGVDDHDRPAAGWWDYPLCRPKPRGGVLGWRTP